jgi:hypothetical protein
MSSWTGPSIGAVGMPEAATMGVSMCLLQMVSLVVMVLFFN